MTTPAANDGQTAGSLSALVADARTLVAEAWSFDRARLLRQVVLLLLNGIVGGVSLLLLIPIVNSIASPESSFTLPLLGQVRLSSLPLPLLLAAFILLTVGSALLSRASSINATALQQIIVDTLRHRAFAAILRARWEFVLGKRRSDIIEVVTTGATRSGFAFYQLLQLTVTLILFVATAIVALIVSPVVAGISPVGVVILGVAQGPLCCRRIDSAGATANAIGRCRR